MLIMLLEHLQHQPKACRSDHHWATAEHKCMACRDFCMSEAQLLSALLVNLPLAGPAQVEIVSSENFCKA